MRYCHKDIWKSERNVVCGMASHTGKIDMIRGSIIKSAALFALPICVGNILQQLYGTVDTLVVGNFCDSAALAAVGTATQPMEILLCVFLGIGNGASILVSQEMGRRNADGLRMLVRTAVWFLYLCAIPVTILAMFVGPALLRLMQVPADAFDHAVLYLRITALGTLGNLGYNMNAGILRGLGDSRIPFLSILVSSLINVLLDILFVAELRWGVLGAAAATVLSQAIMTVFIVLYGTSKYPWLKSGYRKESFCGAVVRDGLRYGLPPMVQSSISALGSLVLQDFMNRFGTDTVTAITTAYRIDTLILLPIVNLGSGISTVTAHSHGAGDTIRTRKTLTAGTILTLVVSAFLTGLVIPTGGKIIALFGAGTAAVAIGSAFFHRIAFFYPIFGLTTAFRGYLEGRGDLVYSSAAGLVSLAVRIIASYAMAPRFGNMTIAYAEMVSWVWLLVMYLFRLAAKKDDAL